MDRKWYVYERDYFTMWVDAVSRKDASDYIKIHLPGATYKGSQYPPTKTTMDCGAVTEARMAQNRYSLEQLLGGDK